VVAPIIWYAVQSTKPESYETDTKEEKVMKNEDKQTSQVNKAEQSDRVWGQWIIDVFKICLQFNMTKYGIKKSF